MGPQAVWAIPLAFGSKYMQAAKDKGMMMKVRETGDWRLVDWLTGA
jgi:hypothetical protein